ncbi:MAG: hypothetical protein JXX29_03975 [Deltaproteobacteria bacterium]|nr:hypothetical protein [Deltaproteobacteria bacterium]
MSIVKDTIKKSIQILPFYPVCRRICREMRFAPGGHYYSPIPSDEDISYALSHRSASHDEISVDAEYQLALLEEISRFHHNIPNFPWAKNKDFLFYYANPYFSFPDVAILTSFLQFRKPKRFVDIGGGITSFLIMDLNRLLFENAPIQLEVIQPFATLITNELSPEKQPILHEKRIQDVDLNLFETMEEDDVLFLDTSHVSKAGSEVNCILFEILPKLKPGVRVHIHDIFFPFEYPEEFFQDGKQWNELYLWRAFLMNNKDYQIELFNAYLEYFHLKELTEKIPNYKSTQRSEAHLHNHGTSLWIQKK